jgi:DNA-directed RNA polymerase subunit L
LGEKNGQALTYKRVFTMENAKLSLNGYRLDCELKGVPVAFVNALRRIALAELPIVVLTNVDIVENTTGLTHEMLRHRVEMMPVNVTPEEVAVIRDTRIELTTGATESPVEVTTDDFTIFGPRKDVLLKDRDLDTPGYFLRLAPGQTLQIKAALGLGSGSQVCVSTFRNHCDPETLRVQRGLWIDNGKDPREFDSFYYQKFYERDENDRPYWFDFTIESVGVLPAKDILRRSVEVLKGKLVEFLKAPVQREEPGWYRIDAEGETFTLGHLVQELLYRDKNVDFVSRDIGHPLVPKLAVRFSTKQQPEKVLETFKREALELCENVLRSV